MPYRTVFSTARPRRGLGRSPRVLVACLAVWILGAASTHATTVESLDFSELHRRAATVVRARCVDRREIPDDGPVPYTRYTFEVVESIKGCRDAHGVPLKRLTVRHGGTRSVYRRSDGLYVLPLRLGIPEYEPGDEVVLFLTKESQLGLCAPVGLGQGAFRIRRVAGQDRVANAYRNRGLFPTVPEEEAPGEKGPDATSDETPVSAHPDGSFALQDFLDRCRQAQAEASEQGDASTAETDAAPPTSQADESKPRTVYRSAPSEVEDPKPEEETGGAPTPPRRLERRSSEEATR